ncbi:MAG: glycosyl hydrolase 53 family protein [Candidatus Hodarchaeota archaeon]
MVKVNTLKISLFLCIILINIVIFEANLNNDKYNLNSNDKILITDIERPFLKLANNLPDSPQLLSPDNESTDTSNIVKFDWTDIGQPTDKIFYEFVMDNDTDFNSPEAARFAINDWSNSTMVDEPYTIFLAHFNDTLKSEEDEDPLIASGLSYSEGKFGKGVLVNGSDMAALSYNITNNLNLEKGTIEFWVKLEEDLSDATKLCFFFDYVMTAVPNVTRLSILVDPNSHKVYAFSVINDTYYAAMPSRVQDWKAGEWHHICLTWGEERARLYLDGIEEAAAPYFPIGRIGDFILADRFYLGSQLGMGNWINATFDEVRISSIERYPLWKPANENVNVTYFIGLPFHRYPLWELNESEYTHMFAEDGTFYWKVRAHNESGPGEWSKVGKITINRILNKDYLTTIKILDKDGDLVPNVNIDYDQKVLSRIMGLDANYYAELLEYGNKWYHNGAQIDLFEFFGKRHSNSFRTRLWTNENGINSLGNATKMAKWAQGNGSIPYLVIFLSDTWADVNKAPLPERFKGLTFEELLDEITEYSENVTQHFINEGISMEYYEIGNEIDFGLCGTFANRSQDPTYNLTWLRENTWYNESRIIKACIEGVRRADPTAEFMLHIALSDPAFALAFYTAMKDYGVDYDIIGLSYHPAWGGDLAENCFLETLRILSTSELPGSDHIVIPETSYGSNNTGTFVFPTWTKNITEFPQDPEGQKAWVKHQLEWMYQTPNVDGMYYFSPEYYNWIETFVDSKLKNVTIWETFAWFNRTGHSKVAVDAYPEFFDLRNISISGIESTNNKGVASFNAYRGFLNLTITIGTHEQQVTVIISPFRDNYFNIFLSINVIDGGGGDGEDDDDDDDDEVIIPGYNLLVLVGIFAIVSVILIKKSKIFQKSKI